MRCVVPILTIIGVIYAAGFIIHFWWIFTGIFAVLLVAHLMAARNTSRPVQRGQSYYSNRR